MIADFTKKKYIYIYFFCNYKPTGSKINVFKVQQITGCRCFERVVIASLEILNIRMMNINVYEGKTQGCRKYKKS
jgi:hypothetical protein